MPGATGEMHVHGLQALNKTFKNAPKETRRKVNAEYRTVAEPVRHAAEAKAVTEIRNIGEPWSRMRVGVTQKVVYVAPKQKGRGLKKRPNLAYLLAVRAMEPALQENRHRIERDFERMLDRLVDGWDNDGPQD